MINNGRIEDLRRDKEAANLSKTAQSERERITPYFTDFMESAYYLIQPYTGEKDEPCQFSRTDMFRAFMYGAREAGHLYWKQEKGEGDGR